MTEKDKYRIKLKKPNNIGGSILELRKVVMYDFEYNYIKNKYDDKAELLFTYTDSSVYKIETANVYEDVYIDKELCDFSKYSIDSKYYDKTNKLVVGKMKGETCGLPIKRFKSKNAYLYNR